MATLTSETVGVRTGDSRTLMLRGERLCRQSLSLCSTSEELLRSSQLRIAASLSWVREHRRHWSSAVGPIIRQKLRDGRLPSKRVASIFGGPGAGGRCGACNRELRSTQLVMELPMFDGHVHFVHGDCFSVWDAERVRLYPSVVGVPEASVTSPTLRSF